MWRVTVLYLLGGMGLLLYGLYIMSEGLKTIAGDKLRTILSTLTKNRLVGLLVGIIVTIIFQSSTATSVILVGLTNASIITFPVVLGAGIGTSITAQLLALNVTKLALPIIGIGGAVVVFAKNQSTKTIGQAVIGFGMLFLGLKFMTNAMEPLRDAPIFVNCLATISNQPLLAIIFASFFTFLIHSSAAAIGIIMVLAMHHLVTLQSAIYLVFGANVGTSFTAILSSFGSTKESQRAALSHFFFRLIGVLVLLPLVKPFASFICWLTPNSLDFQVANVHTLYNIALAIMFLPITEQFAKLMVKLIPDRSKQNIEVKPKYLDEQLITTPSLAIGMALKEIIRISDKSIYIIMHCDQLFKKYDSETVEKLLKIEDEIDLLSKATNNYLTKLMRNSKCQEDIECCMSFENIVSDYEHIGDVVEKNIVYLAESKHANMNDFSKDGHQEIAHMQQKVIQLHHYVNNILLTNNTSLINHAQLLYDDISDMEFRYRISHFVRLKNSSKEAKNISAIFLDLINSYLTIAQHLRNIAATINTNKQISSSEGNHLPHWP
ncbi:Na/Pi cotransporter family protein [Peptococcaceae bacterium 1198_IL3148]